MAQIDLLKLVEQYEPAARRVAETLWNNPELPGEEKESCQLMKDILAEHGFKIQDVATEYIPYAFIL